MNQKPPIFARAARVVALFAVVLLAAGPMLASFGLVAPLTAFAIFALALPVALLAIVLGFVGLITTRRSTGRPGAASAWTGLLVGSLILLGVGTVARGAGDVPPIHDITTDLEDPPVFVVLADVPENAGVDLTYPHGDPATPELQAEAYDDLDTLHLSATPASVLEAATAVAGELGWAVIASSEPTPTGTPAPPAPSGEPADEQDAATEDAGAGDEAGDALGSEAAGDDEDATPIPEPVVPVVAFLEATDTSSIFRFVDDVVVRIEGPDGAEAAHSAVDVRSRSRDGQSDLGVNAARIRSFLEALQARLQ